MISRAVVRRFRGAVVGALTIGAASLLGLLKVLPGSFETVAFLVCGGLIAGLLTPGSVKDGAISGAICGVLVALIMASATTLTSLVEGNPQYPPFWMTFLFYALILMALLLPYSAVGGAAGTAVRNGLRRSGTAGEGERGRWVGIGIGAAVIAGSALVLVYIAPFIIVVPLVGGFIAGYSAGSRPEDGLEAGFVAALFGTALLFFIPLLWTALHDFGFAEMFEGMVVIALVYFFTLLGTAGGIAGAVVRPGPGDS
ncbi:MAG: DUF5518 domain-containing protein [Methanoculleus chikugoensis]|jgi:hypothetical protein|nr:DUF5518 domain-containing protein [Methanoculleus chikugoensis]